MPSALRVKFEKGEKKKLVTVWDVNKVYGAATIRSFQAAEVTVETPVKRRRIGNDIPIG